MSIFLNWQSDPTACSSNTCFYLEHSRCPKTWIDLFWWCWLQDGKQHFGPPQYPQSAKWGCLSHPIHNRRDRKSNGEDKSSRSPPNIVGLGLTNGLCVFVLIGFCRKNKKSTWMFLQLNCWFRKSDNAIDMLWPGHVCYFWIAQYTKFTTYISRHVSHMTLQL